MKDLHPIPRYASLGAAAVVLIAAGLLLLQLSHGTVTATGLPNSTQLYTWQTVPSGAWITGTLNASNSDYSEGETVPFELDIGSLATAGNPYTFSVCRDYMNGTVFGYIALSPYNASRAAIPDGTITSTNGNFSGVNATINSVTEVGGQGACDAGARQTQVSISSVDNTSPIYVLWGGRLAAPDDPGVGVGNGASSYPGGSLHMKLRMPSKDSGINPSAIMSMATFTVNKDFVPDSGASVSVIVSCTSGTPSPASGSASEATPFSTTVTSFTGDPTCTATESPIPAGYTSTGTCSALLSAVSCTITNTRNDTTFTVNKIWSPASGATVSVTVTCTGGGTVVEGAQNVSTASPQTWNIQGYSSTPTCTATEVIPAGYTANGSPAGTCSGTAPGNCTITNTRNDTTFTVNKTWVPASGASVSVTVTCTGGGTVVEGAQNVSTASPQTWNIQGYSTTPTCTATEVIPSGYSASGSPAGTCTGTAPGNCTITNTRNDTTFTVNKVWSPASGASVSVTVTCTGGGAVVEGAQNVSTASPQTWNIQGYSTTPTCTATEVVPSGYSASGSPAGTCSGTAPGDCTITNTSNDATFTVNKVWSPASAASVSVTVTCTGGGTVVQGAQNVSTASPKTWDIQGYSSTPTCTATEVIPSGYSASGSPAGTCSGTAPGSCTITNTRNDTTFTVNKVWSPASASSVSVTVTCTGGGTVVESAQNVSTASPKTWNIQGHTSTPTCTATESPIPAGYTASGSPAGTCSGTAPGDCTITNTQNSAQLHVAKTVTGGTTGDVTIQVVCSSGTVAVNDASATPSGDTADFTITGFNPGATCTVTETAVPGYTFSAGDCPSVTLNPGDNDTCTVTNTRNDTTFTVNKTWVPASGSSVSVAVTCTGGGTVVEGAQNVSTALPKTWNIQGFSTTPTCTATEVIPAGYTASGSPAGTCSGTAPGNCTITNTRNDTTFTVNKVWSPASAASVSVTVMCTGGGTVVQGAQNVSTASPKTWDIQGYSSTPTCTATESPIPAGYTASGSPAGTCSGSAPGNCTITNTQNSANFNVNKTFTPTNGGSVTVSLSCAPNGGTATATDSGASQADDANFTVTGFDGDPLCTATETSVPAGYTTSQCQALLSAGSCTINNTQTTTTFTVNKVWSPASGSSVSVTVTCTGGSTVVEGAQNVSTASPQTWTINGFSSTPICTATEAIPTGYSASGSPAGTCTGTAPGNCTITNTRNDTTFTVNKVWSPASGASVSVTVTCTGGGTVIEGAQSVTTALPKTWNIQGYTSTPTCTATETVPTGYTGSGSPAGTCSGTAPGNCTITNTQLGTIIVQKTTNPGGDPQSFTVNLSGPVNDSGSVTDASDDSFTDLPAGTYALSEVLPSGWQAGSTSCSDGSPIGAIALAIGETVTCVLNNTKLGIIVIQKTTNPAGDATNFAVGLTGASVGSSSISDATDAMFTNRAPGSYTATETLPAPWAMVSVSCNAGSPTPGANSVSFTLAAGATVTCLFTNQTTANFNVNKTFTPSNGGSVTVSLSCAPNGGTATATDSDASQADDANFTVTGFSGDPTCTATESSIPAGYGTSQCQALLSAGSCTIQNTQNTTTFTVNKIWSPASGASVSVTVTCTGGGTVVEGAQNVSTTSPQTWTVNGFSSTPTCTATEVIPSGYSATGSPAGTCSGTAPGNCTISNTRNDAVFTVNKVWSPASGASVSVTVTCTGGGTVVQGSQNVSTALPKTWNIQGYTSTPTCTATETVPTGYTGSGSPAGTCSGTAPGNCTITNTLNSATFTVHKDYSDGTATTVSISLTCDDGTVVLTPKPASDNPDTPAVFTVTGIPAAGTACTATEGTAPTGYTKNETACSSVALAANGTASCTIINTLNGANFTVNKVWSPASAASVSVTVTCTGGGTVNPGEQLVSTASPQTWTVSGFSGTPTCTATEAIPSGYTANGSPAGTCSSTAPGSCTIANTRNDTTFTVNKVWSDAPNAASVSVTVTCTGGGTVVEGAQLVSTASPKTWNIQGYVTTPTCTATEAIPSNYTGSGSPAGTCSGAAPGSCTITNTLNIVGGAVAFNVNKDFQPDDPGDVTVSLVCSPNGGTVTSSDNLASEADDANFTVTGFSGAPTCTATETNVPVGYGTSTCQALLSAGSCTIINIPPAAVTATPNPSAVGGLVDLPVYGPASDGGSNGLGLAIAVMVMCLAGAVGAAWVVKRR